MDNDNSQKQFEDIKSNDTLSKDNSVGESLNNNLNLDQVENSSPSNKDSFNNKYSKILGTAGEVAGSYRRIKNDRENGDSRSKALLKEGGRRAIDYGKKEAQKAIKQEVIKKKARKEAAKAAARKATGASASTSGATATTAAATTGTSTVTAATAAGGGTLAIAGPIILIVIVILIVVIILYIVLTALLLNNYNSNSGSNPAYDECMNEITIYNEDNITNIPLDEYLEYSLYNIFSSVKYDENGEILEYTELTFNNEIYKIAAISERSRILSSMSSDCALHDSQYNIDELNKIKDNTNLPLSEAIASTENELILSTEGLPINSQLDYFCAMSVDDSYYTIYQKNQLIPLSWVDNHKDISDNWKNGLCQANTNSISLYGALYLNEEKKYNYKDIIEYYYGDNISIGFGNNFIGNLEIKQTKNAQYKLDIPIEQYLTSHGSSLNNLNQFISSSVNSAGYGTRNGVIAAAISLINYLYDNFNLKLPYYWNGKYAGKGIPNTFGQYLTPPEISRNGNPYYIKSFDCSGFVQWAIINGGFKNPGTGTANFAQTFANYSCNISENNCVGIPGDLINSANGHVQLIVSVDLNKDIYYVAESTTEGVIVQSRGMHRNNETETYRIIHMDNYYSKSSLN